MPMPSINIVFITQGNTAIQRSQKGIVALVLEDALTLEPLSLTNVTEIPKELGAVNQEYIRSAFIGYKNPPRRVLVYLYDGEDRTLEDGLRYFETQKFDYLAGPPTLTEAEAETTANWVKSRRQEDHPAKAVLPHTPADHEGIINFATDGILVGEKEPTPASYCARIAGLIAGTPMTLSCTYAPLPEISDVERLTKTELDAAVDAGKFILFHDGEKVKTGRAVNSLVSATQGKGEAYKKIKLVEAMDMIQSDIRATVQDHYIGKFANSYDNKCILIMAIKGYLEVLERDGILARGYSEVDIDLEAQEAYLRRLNIDTSEWTVQQIKEADTGSKVFLEASIRILDAIEDINLSILI